MDLLIQIMVFMFIITLVIMVINHITIHFIFYYCYYYCYGLEMFWNCCLDSFINYRINICLFSNICYCCFIIIRDFIIRGFINLGYCYCCCIGMNFVGLVIRYFITHYIILNVKNHHFINYFIIFYELCLC